MPEPLIPEGITGYELDREINDELRSLSKETALRVAQHLVAAAALIEDQPEGALEHARFAARRGGRIGAVREAYGIAAYRNGDYRTAIKELRTAVRITGRTDLLPMIADCERGLGRPEKALDMASSAQAEQLSDESTIEMMIVVAGAYADTGDIATALASLEIPALRQKVNGKWQVRLWVAYADLLERAGRSDEARRWLELAADADTEQLTDAGRRLGRPAPAPDDSPWEDAESISVLDALVEAIEEETESPESEAPESDRDEPQSPESHAEESEGTSTEDAVQPGARAQDSETEEQS